MFEIISSMREELPYKRPNCFEKLEEKLFWALRENEFEFEKQLKIILDIEVVTENDFINFFLEVCLLKSSSIALKKIKSRDERESFITKFLLCYQHRVAFVEKCLNHLLIKRTRLHLIGTDST